MKIVNLSSFDLAGGAARSAYRMHQGLLNIDIDSLLLVQHKQSSDPTVRTAENKLIAKLRSTGDSTFLSFYRNRQHFFSPQRFPDALPKYIDRLAPDIVNLHWICNGFVSVEALSKFKKPLVWTINDMWPFTGGCHYSLGCDLYTKSCGNCPQLHSNREFDLSRSIWQRKAKQWQDLNLTVVAFSQWMADCAKASKLFQNLRIEVIPPGLDIKVFKPVGSQFARELLDLPLEKKLVLFGAIGGTEDKRKGFHLLEAALKQLSNTSWKDCIELVVFGANRPKEPLDLGFPIHYLGKLQDELSLRVAYAAADVLIAPSIEEAFGQVASESLACGTPVIVFANTGLMDIVEHQQNGYVAKYCDTEDLATGITWVLEDLDRHKKMRLEARAKAEREYASEVQANRYLNLFHEILQQSNISQSLSPPVVTYTTK
jgi:glycosyltransferase involved in cell wall biosynthesis